MLQYISNGSFVAGVPARDLSDEEVKLFGEKWLLATGLYKKKRRKKIKQSEVKNGNSITKKSTDW